METRVENVCKICGKRYRVPLGDKYEVSIISTAYSYGGSLGLYEIALMKDGKIVKLSGKVEGFQDDDVLGYLTEDDVRKYIEILREFVRTGRRPE